MSELDVLRSKINMVDEAILSLLEERRNIVCDIFEYKKENGLSLQDGGREEALIQALSKKTDRFSQEELHDIWRAIITSSYNILS